jgi:hypothetical protein
LELAEAYSESVKAKQATERAEAGKTGWPHVSDPMAVRDLDRDPNMVSIHNRVTGKKVRDELPKFENYRAGEPPLQVGIEVMLPK